MSGPKPRRPRAGLDRLVGELEGAGEVVAEGGFTLDRDRAKEKVRDFALEDPNRYVLLLVQAAAAKGASRVGFEIDSDDMRIRFDGEPFTARDLDQLYAEMFSERPDDHAFACRELALGLLGAMATDPAWVKVESGDGESGARLYMQPGQADRIEAAPGVVAGTSIHVKSRLGFRTLARFGRDVLGALPEEARIQEHCRRAPYEVSIDGRRVSEGMPTDVLAPTTHRARGIEIFAGFRPSTEPASLEILCRGVWVTTHALPDLPPQLVVIADVAALHRDITQFEVVRDAAYERLLHEVHAAYEAALAELVRIVSRDIADARSEEIPAPASALEAALPAWLRAYLEGELVRRTRTARGQGGPGLSRKLWSLRLFRTIAGRSISARELERSNPVVIAPSPPGELDAVEFPDAIALQDPSTRATLDTIFGTKVRDLAEARTRGEIRASRRGHRARRVASVLALGMQAREPIAGDGVAGELGLRAADGDLATIRLVKEGRLLAELRLHGAPSGIVAVVEGDFGATDRPDVVACDDTLERAALATLAALHRMMSALSAERGARRPGRAIRRALVQYLAAVHRDLPERMFEALGFGSWATRALCRRARSEAPAPELQLDTAHPHALARVALFVDAEGDAVGLADLHGRLAEAGEIVVTRSRRPHAGEHALRVDDAELELLEAVFGRARLRELE